MKYLFIFLLSIISITAFAQKKEYNTKKGAIANGYDVVAYFSNKAVKGQKKLSMVYHNVSFRFSSKKNLEIFKKKPMKYIPQYGGYCAYAVGKKAQKIDIDPQAFEIRNGKLYLFYNSLGTNTLKLWLKENTEKLLEKANANWTKIKKN